MSPRGEQVYRCGAPGCKKERHSDVNHWVILFAFSVFDSAKPAFSAFKWDQEVADIAGAEYACGYDHASILFARWMSTGTLQDVREVKS